MLHPEYIKSDVTRLRQILVNLLGNAIKFTQKGSVKVIVKLLSIDAGYSKIEFSVIDSGIGIPKDRLEKIFEPFTQLDSSISRKYGGTGLGLTISKRLTNLLGGELNATSTPGLGSHFSFFITAELAKEKPLHLNLHKTQQSNPSNVVKINILLVEDNLINQKLTKKILEKKGFPITDIANNGKEAIDFVEKKEYAIILMDIQMPEMDGITATKLIREMNLPKRPHIIAMTANAMVGDREKYLEVGMDDYISKPVNQDELIEKLKQFVSQKQSI